METKLTLKLDQNVIFKIKKYAETHNRSLSKLVEDYFRNLILDTDEKHEFSPLVEELSGVISLDDIKNNDYSQYLENKYE